MAARAIVEILPIMLALCLMLFNAHYAQNYAGIIGASLLHTVGGNDYCSYTSHIMCGTEAFLNVTLHL